MQLTVVIVSWNTRALLAACLDSLRNELYGLAAEVYVVDNDSADGSAEMVARDYPWVRLIANESNRGFAAANNQVFALARGEKVLLLNPDTEVRPGAVRTLMRILDKQPDIAVVAPQLLNADGSIQRSCRQFPTFLSMFYELLGMSKIFPNSKRFGQYKMLDFRHDYARDVDQPEGACLMLRKKLLEEIGSLDEGYFMLFEEVDWCYRIKQAGGRIWFTPDAQVVHHYGQSIKQVKAKMILSSHRGLIRFWRKHYRNDRMWLDPFVAAGLMSLAYVRLAAYVLRNATGTTPVARAAQPQPSTRQPQSAQSVR
jgi:GT2 family glycosyltransferase